MVRAIPFLLVALALAGGCQEEEDKPRAPVSMQGGDDSTIVPGDAATETEGPLRTMETGTTSVGSGPGTGAGTAADTAGGGTTGGQGTSDDGPSLTTDELPPD